jgi:amidohydrolase
MTSRTPAHDAQRAAALAAIAGASERLTALAAALHADPELSFDEHRAVARIAGVLAEGGLEVETGVHDLPTAFRVEAGRGETAIVVCAEYDALPEVGHACGHNLIAAGAVGAMLALAPLADDLGLRVVLLGTPAEEHGAGKQLLLERGAWDDATASLMVHPASGREYWPDAVDRSAVHRLRVIFRGRAAHAAAAPDRGVNAGDAATLALVALGLLRQQVADGMRFNAFVRQAGEVTNIIPAYAEVDLEVRGPDVRAQALLEERVLACFHGAALATGCTAEVVETEPLYEQVEADPDLALLFADALRAIGRPADPAAPHIGGGSTDMGNVSRYLPSIHPTVSIRGTDAALHTVEFAEAAGTPEGLESALDAARAMALTVIDLAHDESLRARLAEARSARSPYAARPR